MKSSTSEKASKDSEELKERGNLAFNEGNWDKAIAFYTKALDFRPDWGIVYSNRSHAYGKAGRHVEALADAIRCVELERKWWKSFLRLGEAYMRLERYREACEAFWQSSICRSISCPNERFPELERRLEEAKKKSIDTGQGCPSLPSLEVVQMARTAEGYTEISRGNGALRQNDWEQACEHYGKALDCVPVEEIAACHKYRSFAFERLGKYKEALEEADYAVQADPTCWLGAWLRATALLGQRRAHEAYDEIAKAEKMASDKGIEVRNLLSITGKSAKEFVGDVKTKLQNELVRFRSPDHETAKQRGNEAFKKGEFQDAIGHYSTALILNPSWAVVYANRCTSRLKLQQLDLALDDAEKCVECDRGWWKGHLRLGEVLNELGQHHQALSCLQEARSKVGNGEADMNNLRYILHQIGRTEGLLLVMLQSQTHEDGEEKGKEKAVEGKAEKKGAALNSTEKKSEGECKPRAAVEPRASAATSKREESRVMALDSESEGDLDDQELSEGARARAEAALARRQYDVAIDQLSYAMSLVQDSAELYALRCEAYMAKAEEASDPTPLLKRAEEDAKRLLELDVAGELCERMGRPEQARMMYARAVEEDPMLSVAVVRLCMLTKTLPIGSKGLSKRVRMVLECAERDGVIDGRAAYGYPSVLKGSDANRHSFLDREKRVGPEPPRPVEKKAQKEAPIDKNDLNWRRKAAEAGTEPEVPSGMGEEAQEWCDAYLSDRGKMSEFLSFVSRIAAEGPGGGAGLNSEKLADFAKAAQKEMMAWTRGDGKGGDGKGGNGMADLGPEGERRKQQVEMLFQKVNGLQLWGDCTLAEALEKGMKDGAASVRAQGGKGQSVEGLADGEEGGEAKKKKKKAKKKKKKATPGEGGADPADGDKGEEGGEAEMDEGEGGAAAEETAAVQASAEAEEALEGGEDEEQDGTKADAEQAEEQQADESGSTDAEVQGIGQKDRVHKKAAEPVVPKAAEGKMRSGSSKVLPAPVRLQVADLDHGIHRVVDGKTVIGAGADDVINISFCLDTDQGWNIHSVQAQVNNSPLKLQRLPTGPKMYCALPRSAITGECAVQLRIRKKGGDWSEWSEELVLVEGEDAKAQAAKAAKKAEAAAEEARAAKAAAQRVDDVGVNGGGRAERQKDSAEGGASARGVYDGPDGKDVTAAKEPSDTGRGGKLTHGAQPHKGNAAQDGKNHQRDQGGQRRAGMQSGAQPSPGRAEGTVQQMLDDIGRAGVVIDAMVLKDLHSLGESLAKTALSSLISDLSEVENPSAFLSAVVQSLLDQQQQEQRASEANGSKGGGYSDGAPRSSKGGGPQGGVSADGDGSSHVQNGQGGPACVAVEMASAEAVAELVNAMQALGLMGQFDLLEMTNGQSQAPSRWTLVASYRGEDGSGQRVNELLRSLQQFCGGRGGAVPRLVRVGQRQCTEMLQASGWSVVKQGLFSPQQAAAAGVQEAGERMGMLENQVKRWMEILQVHQERCLGQWNQQLAMQKQAMQHALHEIEGIFGVLQQFLAVLPAQTNTQIQRLKVLREGVLLVMQHATMHTGSGDMAMGASHTMQHVFPNSEAYSLYMQGGPSVWAQAQGGQWNGGMQDMSHMQNQMDADALQYAAQTMQSDGITSGLPPLLDPVWGNQSNQLALGDLAMAASEHSVGGASGLMGGLHQQPSNQQAHALGLAGVDMSGLPGLAHSSWSMGSGEPSPQQEGLGLHGRDALQGDALAWEMGMGGLHGQVPFDTMGVSDVWSGVDQSSEEGWTKKDTWEWEGGSDGMSGPQGWSSSGWAEDNGDDHPQALWSSGVAEGNGTDASLWGGTSTWSDGGTSTWSGGGKGMGWSSFPVDSG